MYRVSMRCASSRLWVTTIRIDCWRLCRSTSSLADGIASLWENPERRREIGATGYDGVRAHYGTKQMLAEVMEVYRRLAAPDVAHTRKQ
jgi:spore maturation protein CgeB